jgi:2-polyprenyl-3-methyl-5-hydroxy-6-metoxy-1,4-benzoquinol methylase
MREDDIRPQALLDEFFARLKRDAERLATKCRDFVEVPCPICEGERRDVAFAKEGFTYCQCQACDSLYVTPRPTPQALAEYASTSEAAEFWSSHFYKQTAEARRRQIYRPRASLVADIARQQTPAPSCLVDVGAGYGLFLQEMAALKLFTPLVAVEPDSRLAPICREQGFPVVEKWVEDVEEGEIAVDFATAFEVIEHVFDPRTFLAGCGRLLRPGGMLLLTTLTISGFDLQVLWEHSRSISPPQHLNFPSIKGIARLAERVGFEVVRITTPGQLDIDIVRNRLAAHPELPVPRFARALVQADENTRAEFQSFLQAHCMSSHLHCLARKPG